MKQATRLIILICGVFIGGFGRCESWVLIFQTLPHLYSTEASKYYVDVDSFKPSVVDKYRYTLAHVKTEHRNSATNVDVIAVLCAGADIAPALSIRKMGKLVAKTDVVFDLDFGPIASLEDFQLKNLKYNTSNLFASQAWFVCKNAK